MKQNQPKELPKQDLVKLLAQILLLLLVLLPLQSLKHESRCWWLWSK